MLPKSGLGQLSGSLIVKRHNSLHHSGSPSVHIPQPSVVMHFIKKVTKPSSIKDALCLHTKLLTHLVGKPVPDEKLISLGFRL